MNWLYFNSLPNFPLIKVGTVRFGTARRAPALGAPSTGWPRGTHFFQSPRTLRLRWAGQAGVTGESLGVPSTAVQFNKCT